MDASAPKLTGDQILVWVAIGIGLLGDLIAVGVALAGKMSRTVKVCFLVWTIIVGSGLAYAICNGDEQVRLWCWIGLMVILIALMLVFRERLSAGYWNLRAYCSLSGEVRRLGTTHSQKTRLLESTRQLLSHCKHEEDVQQILMDLSDPTRARDAGPDEVNRALKALYLLEGGVPSDELEAKRDALVKAFCNDGLFRLHRHGFEASTNGKHFKLEFDIFRFLVGAKQHDTLSGFRENLRTNIKNRFSDKGIHTLVYINRGRTYPGQKFFEGLKQDLAYDEVIAFVPKGIRIVEDTTWLERFSRACGGKKVLLVDPLFVDYALDEAYEEITRNHGGNIEGVVVMFEVDGAKPEQLRNHDQLSKKSGARKVRGQVLLDLIEFNEN